MSKRKKKPLLIDAAMLFFEDSEQPVEASRTLRPGARAFLEALTRIGWSVTAFGTRDVVRSLEHIDEGDLVDAFQVVAEELGDPHLYAHFAPRAVRFDGDFSKALTMIEELPFWETEPKIDPEPARELRQVQRPVPGPEPKANTLQGLRIRLREVEDRVKATVSTTVVELLEDEGWTPDEINRVADVVGRALGDGHDTFAVLRSQADEYRFQMRVAYGKAKSLLGEAGKYSDALQIARSSEGTLRARVIELEGLLASSQATVKTMRDRAVGDLGADFDDGTDADEMDDVVGSELDTGDMALTDQQCPRCGFPLFRPKDQPGSDATCSYVECPEFGRVPTSRE